MYEFKLPDLGEGIHEGEILQWHVSPGDVINEDDPLVEVETDKAAVTIPTPKGGKVVSISGKSGEIVKVGVTLVVIDDGSGNGKSTPASVSKTKSTEKKKPAQTKEVVKETKTTVSKTQPVAAPATRKLARELGVDITQVTGSGPGGRITNEDIQAFASGGKKPAIPQAGADRGEIELGFDEGTFAGGTAPSDGIPLLNIEPLPDFSRFGQIEVEEFRSIRRKVARKMVTSMILVPHVWQMDEADVTLLEEYREKINEAASEGTPKLTLLPFIVKALTLCLKKYPRFNASLDPFNERIIYKKYYNMGIAVDTGKGLIVPVIKDVDSKSIMEIAGEILDVATRAREGKLVVDDLQGGTFSITNIGALGGTGLVPAINYPEVAILGTARTVEKPAVRNGQIVIRKMMPVTLAFDHRIADGADAARFMNDFTREMSAPSFLL